MDKPKEIKRPEWLQRRWDRIEAQTKATGLSVTRAQYAAIKEVKVK